MENWLKGKSLGLPRWAWVTMVGGAVILGLYLRRRAAKSETEGEIEGASAAEGTLGYYNGTEAAGGLAAAGLVGPAQGQVVPIEAPYIPEGFVDMFGQLTTVISELGAYITEHQNVQTENPPTGGGAPETPGGEVHETTPAPNPATCPANIADKIHKNRAEMTRLQGEIDELQHKIQTHPNAKEVNAWRANIQGKRAKVSMLSAENSTLRNISGCKAV